MSLATWVALTLLFTSDELIPSGFPTASRCPGHCAGHFAGLYPSILGTPSMTPHRGCSPAHLLNVTQLKGYPGRPAQDRRRQAVLISPRCVTNHPKCSH